jgi:hypothetical protein
MKMTDTIFRFIPTALPPFLSFVINFRPPTGRWPFRLPTTTTFPFVNDAQSCHACPLSSLTPLLITLDGLPFSLSLFPLLFFFFSGRGFLCHGVVPRSFFIRSIYIP